MHKILLPLTAWLSLSVTGSGGAMAQHEDHAAPAGRPVARVSYVANAGISVATVDIGALIDVLFREGQAPFARIPDATIQHIETAGQPFDEVRAVMVTNRKPDHFDAKSVSRFLHHNPAAVLLAPPQVLALLRAEGTEVERFNDRIREANPQGAEKVTVELPDMTIDVLRLSHDPEEDQPVENFGFIVHLAERRLVHVGDAKFDEVTRAALLAHAKNVDMVCVPYWWFDDEAARKFLSDELQPGAVAAVHVPPDRAEAVEAEVKSKMERAVVLIRPFASRRL